MFTYYNPSLMTREAYFLISINLDMNYFTTLIRHKQEINKSHNAYNATIILKLMASLISDHLKS